MYNRDRDHVVTCVGKLEEVFANVRTENEKARGSVCFQIEGGQSNYFLQMVGVGSMYVVALSADDACPGL